MFCNTSFTFFGSPNLGKATAAARAALPIPISMCSIFVCPNNGMAASAWDFLTCEQISMRLYTGAVRTP